MGKNVGFFGIILILSGLLSIAFGVGVDYQCDEELYEFCPWVLPISIILAAFFIIFGLVLVFRNRGALKEWWKKTTSEEAKERRKIKQIKSEKSGNVVLIVMCIGFASLFLVGIIFLIPIAGENNIAAGFLMIFMALFCLFFWGIISSTLDYLKAKKKLREFQQAKKRGGKAK